MSQPTRCPACASENVMFSRKRNLHLCEECGREFTTEKLFISHRVFLSYGHDEHVSLALRLRDDLKARGHEVWFDEQRLQPGHDWEANIEEGIERIASAKPCAAVVLLLTPYAVRRPDGYCLNEVTRALARGLRVIPLMVVSSEPPLSICRIQWLDMRECIPINEKAAMYHPRFERLVEALEEGRLDFEGSQQRLLKALQPLEFEADVLHHLPKFIGREWVFAEIQRWLADPGASRVFWITGGPGVGKTALSAWISSHHPELMALHLCKFGHAQKSDPRAVVTSLVYQLSTQLPDYEAALAALDVERFAADDARTIFDNLLVQPLAMLRVPDRIVVMLIDALDEATRDGRNELASFIASEFEKTPGWLRLIITSRPEQAVESPLQSLNPFVLDTEIEANRSDLRAYLRRELDSILGGRADADSSVESILKHSEGVFLYVERVCDDLRRGHLSLDRPNEFPQGLGGVFWQFFERQFPNLDHFRQKVRPALRAILAAREPLPLTILQELFHWQEEELRDFTRQLGSLFPVSEEGRDEVIRPYHKSLADWLGDESKAGAYFVSTAEGHRILAETCWQQYQENVQTMSSYALRYLSTHLGEARRLNAATHLLTDLSFIATRCKKGMGYELSEDYLKILSQILPQSFASASYTNSRKSFNAGQSELPEATKLLLQYSSFFSSRRHLMIAWPDSTFEIARNHSSSGPVAEAGEIWLKKRGSPWLARHPRPQELPVHPAFEGCIGEHDAWVSAVAISENGEAALSGAADKVLKLWDLSNRLPVTTMKGHSRTIQCVSLSWQTQTAATGSWDGELRIWDLRKGECIACFKEHQNVIISLAIIPHRFMVVTASWDKTIRVWDFLSKSCVAVFSVHDSEITCLAISADGRVLGSASRDGTVIKWNAEAMTPIQTLHNHKVAIESLALNHDGSSLVIGTRNGMLRVWHHEALLSNAEASAHVGPVTAVGFVEPGGLIASSGQDGKMRTWKSERLEAVDEFDVNAGPINTLAIAGTRVVTGGSDRSIKLWNVAATSHNDALDGHSGRVTSIAISNDGKTAISGGEDGAIRSWCLETGCCLGVWVGHKSKVNTVALSSDGTLAFSGGRDGTLRIWDASSGHALSVAKPDDRSVGGVKAIAIDCTGDWLVVGRKDSTLTLWNLPRFQPFAKVQDAGGPVSCVCFKQKSKRVIAGCLDRSIRVWDMETLQCLMVIDGHAGEVWSLAELQPDELLLSGGADRSLHLSGKQLSRQMTLPGHLGGIRGVGGMLNGRWLVSGSSDQTVRVWDGYSGACVAQYCAGSAITSLTTLLKGTKIVCGTENGRLHFLDFVCK